MNGRGAVNRRLVEKAESGVHLKGTIEKVHAPFAGSLGPGFLGCSGQVSALAATMLAHAWMVVPKADTTFRAEKN